MKIITEYLAVSTKGFTDIVNITNKSARMLGSTDLQKGNITFFVSGSTAGITTLEYEPGLLKDIPEALEKIAPRNAKYHHDETWGDGNGNSHVRAALIGPSLTVPFSSGRMLLGTWQQIVLIDFDNRSREREIVMQIIGE